MSVSATSSVVRTNTPTQSQFVSAKSDRKSHTVGASTTQQSAFVKASAGKSGEVGGTLDVKL